MAVLSRQANPSPAHWQAAGVQPHVLVVEDHDDTRFMLKYMLEQKGCRVSVAADGEDALRLAESERPDLILMDATLPRLDGLAATLRIRATPTLRDVPVVFLSGHAEPPFRAAALATGGNDFLIKPFEMSQLGKVLERHLGLDGAAKKM
jgi:two-component system phosphate regulon response regulator PhoB